MQYQISVSSLSGKCELKNNTIEFLSDVSAAIFFEMVVEFHDWEEDAFVFMPSCAYNGNRFKKVNRPYPPRFLPEEYGIDPELIINKLPSLQPDGSGEIEVTSGDMAVPCIGIFYKNKKEAILLFTEQQIKDKNLGFTVKAGKIIVSFPANRKVAYRFNHNDDLNPDSGVTVKKGERLQTNILLKKFQCNDFTDFYSAFFEYRKELIKSKRAKNLYSQKLWDLMTENKIISWKGRKNANWVCGGWAGGTGMEHIALIKKGDARAKELAIALLDFETLPEHQGTAGFFYSSVKEGVSRGNMHYVRNSAGALYFILKIFDVIEPKPQWIECAKRCLDAFVKLFHTYGKFGRNIDSDTGEMIMGGGFTGVGAISALAKGAVFFQKDEYKDVACRAGEYYYNEFAKTGMTYGGPSDILCAPDSESAFLLLEAFVNLYELTKEEKWLERAKVCLHYCSSWVVSYSYNFPKGSEFEKLGINTVGSVFASVQNKHAAPGICVLSGDSIFKLYRYTGNKEYLELIKDIAYFIPQCISTKERPIFATIPKTLEESARGEYLPIAAMNERVNMSDWEYQAGVGNIICERNWCENAFLLSYAELLDYDEFKEALDERKQD